MNARGQAGIAAHALVARQCDLDSPQFEIALRGLWHRGVRGAPQYGQLLFERFAATDALQSRFILRLSCPTPHIARRNGAWLNDTMASVASRIILRRGHFVVPAARGCRS